MRRQVFRVLVAGVIAVLCVGVSASTASAKPLRAESTTTSSSTHGG